MSPVRICESCGRTFEEDVAKCPHDGVDLSVAHDPTIGTKVGRYILVKRLGKGAMGSVYLGLQPVIRSRVAIKILHESAEEDPTQFSRFVREAQAVNEIRHPNIVRITDMDKLADGRPFILMEYLEGVTLRQRMTQAPLEPDQAYQIVKQALEALQAAHDAGFVHRDLKPDNIFVTNEGQVKLLDFGIAKLLGQSDRSLLTQEGAVVGTPMYVAPEQAEGRIDLIGPWTDLYSVGAILYEMYTGTSPFESKSVAAVLLAHVRDDPPPPSQRRPEITPELERVILCCLKKDAKGRPDSAKALLESYSKAHQEYAEGLKDTLPGATLPQFVMAKDWVAPSGDGEGSPDSSPSGMDVASRTASARGERIPSPSPQGLPEKDGGKHERSAPRTRWLTYLVVPATVAVAVLMVGFFLWRRYSRPVSKETLRQTSTEKNSPTVKPAIQPEPPGRLVILQSYNVVSLVPNEITNAESVFLVTQTHEPLVRYDPLLGKVEPCLATSWDQKGDTYTFKLRQGVRFHDGTHLTAQIAVDSLRQTRHSGLGKVYMWDVREIKATSRMEVSIRLAQPSGSFLTRIFSCPAFVNRPGSPYPLGTGAYKVKAWNKKVGAVVLSPHRQHWGGSPKIEIVVFKAEPDPEARASLLLQGDAQVTTSLPPHVAKRLEQKQDIQVLRTSTSTVEYLCFNTRKPYLRDPKTRRALSLAVDRDRLVNELYKGGATKAACSIPPGIPGAPKATRPVEYAPKEAMALLKKTDLVSRTLTLYFFSEKRDTIPDPKLAAQILVDGFQSAGVRVKSVVLPYTAFMEACRAGEHDMAFFGWRADYPDPENVYFLLGRKGMEAGLNFSHYVHPQFEGLLHRARIEENLYKRRALFSDLERMVEEQRPWLPLAYTPVFFAKRNEVRGFRFDISLGSGFLLRNTYLKR